MTALNCEIPDAVHRRPRGGLRVRHVDGTPVLQELTLTDVAAEASRPASAVAVADRAAR